MGHPHLHNVLQGIIDNIESGAKDVWEEIEDGSLSVFEAMEHNVLDVTEVGLEEVVERGLSTSLDVFRYIKTIAQGNLTGNFYGTSDSDVIVAADILGTIPSVGWLRDIWGSGGSGGKIYAKEGDDIIIMAALAATVYTGSGNDSVIGGSEYLKIIDTSGDLKINTLTGYADVEKTENGHIKFIGSSMVLKVEHSGNQGDIKAYTESGLNVITRSGGDETSSASGASGNIKFYGGGASNIITHSSNGVGKIDFYGLGASNIIKASGYHKDIDFYGVGGSNIIINSADNGTMNIHAAGLGSNLIIKKGSGNLHAYLVSAANVTLDLGHGDGKISMLGGLNTHTKVGNGDTILAMAGEYNVATLKGNGDLYGELLGAGNVVTKVGNGHMYLGLAAAGNVISHIGGDVTSDDTILAFGGFNVITKAGQGDLTTVMAGGVNLATHVGVGNIKSVQLGGANILTKVDAGNVTSLQFGESNILTQVGNGESLAALGGNYNVFTKVGDGKTIAAMTGFANAFTHVGHGDSYGFMAGAGNIFTKVGGMSGTNVTPADITLAAMFADYNLFTHIGNGDSYAMMAGAGNIFTKVGGTSGDASNNILPDTTLAAMFADLNLFTHIGDGITAALMMGSSNIFTKVGNIAANDSVVALMAGGSNVSTHIGDGRQINLVAGDDNVASKLGDGDQINVAVGKNNILTHVNIDSVNGYGNSYNLAEGDNNIVTKIGNGMQVTALFGENNVITHVGNGDGYQFAYGGEANFVTKVGEGDLVAGLIAGQANVITQIGAGAGYYGMWGDNNVATKIGDGTAVAVMLGINNLLTDVGDGLQVSLMSGDNNVNTKIGDGHSINITNGKENLVTKIGDGLHLAAMKGETNINIHVGDGTSVAAMHANQNLTVKIGNGDFYALSIARSDASFKEMLGELFSHIKDTTLGYIVSDVIGQVVWYEGGDMENVPSDVTTPVLSYDENSNIAIDSSVTMQTTAIDENDLDRSAIPDLSNGGSNPINQATLEALPYDAYDAGKTDTTNPEGEYQHADSGASSQPIGTGDPVVQTKVAMSVHSHFSTANDAFKGDEVKIVVGDFNGDGSDDFIRQEEGDHSSLYVSNGDGTFNEQVLTDGNLMKGDETNLIIGDFNGDNIDDFIRQDATGTSSIYYANSTLDVNGDVTFNASILTDAATLDGDETNIIVADFNGDGSDDFVKQTKGNTDNSIHSADLYLSNVNGTFTSSAIATDYTLMDADKANIIVGDFDGDGNDDFIKQTKGNTDSSIHSADLYLSNANGTFTSSAIATDYALMDADNANIIVGDFNGDGSDDFIRQETAGNSSLYVSNGDGTFSEQAMTDETLMKGDETKLIVADFNGDGMDDFIRQEIQESATSPTTHMFLATGGGNFTSQELADHEVMEEYANNLIVGDFDNDGNDDFIRQETGVSDDDDYNTVSLYLNKEGTNEGVGGAVSTTAEVNFLMTDHINDAGDAGSFIIDDSANSANSTISRSAEDGNSDIVSLEAKRTALKAQAEGVKTNLENDASTLLNYLTDLGTRYSEHLNDDGSTAMLDDGDYSATNNDDARSYYNIGILDQVAYDEHGNEITVGAYLDKAEDKSTIALENSKEITDPDGTVHRISYTDYAENELSKAGLNADKSHAEAMVSHTDATIAEDKATSAELTAHAAVNTAQDQSDNAANVAQNQSATESLNGENSDGRTASSGSGLTVDNSGYSQPIAAAPFTDTEISTYEDTLLSNEDEMALAAAENSVTSFKPSQDSSAINPYAALDSNDEGVNNNPDVVDIPDAGFLADGGEFKDVSFGTKRKADSDFQDSAKRVKKVNDNVSGYEGVREGVNLGIIDIKDAVEGDGLFISQAYDEVYSYTVNAFGEEGGVSFSDANITLIAKLRTQYEASSGTAGSRAKIGEEVFDSFFNESNLLLRTTIPEELFDLVKEEGNADLSDSEFVNRVEDYLNTKLESALENQFFDGEGDNAVVKSDNKFNYSAVNSQLNNIGYELVDADNKAYSSSAGTDIKNKWLDSLPSNDPAAELVKSLVFDAHGRSERDAYAKSTVYKEVYGDDIVNPHGGANGINGIWDSITQARGIADTYLSTDSGKPSSINHILAESSITVLLSDAAFKISQMPDGAEKTAHLATMKSFFDKVAGVNDGGFNGASQSFSDIANAHFVAAVASSNINLTELSHSMAAISYAPGNVRWGDGSLNSARGNFLDPIFTKDSEGTVELSASSISVKNAVESLNGIVDVSVTNAALSMDMHIAGTDARMYSTNKVIDADVNAVTGVDITPDVNGDIHLGEHLSKIFDYSKETGAKSVIKTDVENDIEYKFKPDGNIEGADSNNIFTVKNFNHTQQEANNLADRQKSHDLIKNEDGTFAQNEDGTFKTKLTEKDSSYEAIEKGTDIVVYKYTDSAGDVSYRVVNTEKEYSIYMKTPPVIDANGNLDLSGRSAHTYGHGEKTGTYTKDSASITSSFYGEDNKILQSSPLGIIDSANQARYDQTAFGVMVDDYKLTKPREEYLANEDTYQKKHLDQLMHATIDKMSANDIVIVPGKYTDLTRRGLESDLNRYGVTDNRMHICRDDDVTQIHTLTISPEVEAFAPELKNKIVNNINGETSAKHVKTIDSEVNSVKSNAPIIHSDSNDRDASYKNTIDSGTPNNSDDQEATKGNVQLQVGDGEYVAGLWGDNNLGLKIGTGGFKGAAFGENNILAHIGNAGDNVSYSTTVGGYDAFEGAQLLIGSRNLSFNYGDSNDFIVALDKSIPLPPFVSPFSGPSNIVGYLKDEIVVLGEETDGARGADFYYKQNQLWSHGQAESIVNNLSGLDQNSFVHYGSLFDYGTENERDARVTQSDADNYLNNAYNNWRSPGDQSSGDVNIQANVVIAGQGADIIMANGENQFLFGDNIQSILDTTFSSLFGIMTQSTVEHGMVTRAFSYNPANLPSKLQTQAANIAAVTLPGITLGDIFGIDYNANGSLYKFNGEGVTGSEIVNVLEVLEQFGNTTIEKYLTPDGIMNNIKSSLNEVEGTADKIKEIFGLETSDQEDPNAAPTSSGSLAREEGNPNSASSGETLGFGGLTLPSIFNIADIANEFSSIPDLINDLAGTINSFGNDAANIEDAILDFFTTSGYMTDDGDLIVSLGNSNYSWGGHGDDIGAFLGLNNNFWGGRGDDMFYGLGENNQASGNEGNDTGILLGVNNLFLGGQGDDFALASGRLNNLSGGTGDDSLFAFGSSTVLMGDEGDDYLMSAGVFTTIQGGEGHDYIVSTGHHAQIHGDAGKDSISVFGNLNSVLGGNEGDMIRILGHQSTAYGQSGDDVMTLDAKAKSNLVKGGTGNDSFVLGGYDNTLYGESGSDQFLINHAVINNTVKDVTADDFILFEDIDYNDLWFERQGDDLEIYVDRGFSDGELQSAQNLANEEIGVVSLTDYFLHNATGIDTNIAISYTDSSHYSILTKEALDDLILTMSNYEIEAFGNGFFANVSLSDEDLILNAWQDSYNYITGDDTANDLYGYYDLGRNIINGGLGDDAIYGGLNADIIDGEEGNDFIYGGVGQDSLTGGTGSDSFLFESLLDSTSTASDIITDFTKGEDKIDLSNLTFIGLTNDHASTDATLLTYLYDNENNQTIVTETTGNFQFKLSGDITLDVSDFNFMNNVAGRNVIVGTSGNDTFYSSVAADIMDGGAGIDYVRYDQSISAVTVDLSDNANNHGGYAEGDELYNIERVFGSSHDDTITGNATANSHIYAQDGDDTLIGGSEGDTLKGGTGDDTIHGGDGNDAIYGDSGNNSLFGEGGNDTFYSGVGTDMIDGGAGSDYVRYDQSTSAVTVDLGDINNNLTSIENISGSNYADYLTGDSGKNVIYGQNGDDTIIGGLEGDTLFGGTGSDSFLFASLLDSTSSASDIIADFIKGDDKIDVSALAFNGLTNDQAQTDVTLLTYTYDHVYNKTIVTDENTFQFKLVGNIILDASDFIFNNGVGRDVIIGTSGNDVITGGLGNDSLYGEDGNDVIDGGNGNDVIDGGIGDDHLYGDDGDDLIWGRSGIDIIQGGNGDDVISGESGDDYLFGGNGNDELSGGSGNDHLAGNDGDDIISGGSGDDDIEGGYGNDTIYGNSGNNSLRGDDGDDIFYSGSGADIIIGGSGIDFVVYSQSTSAVTVDLNSSIAQQGGYAQGDILSGIEKIYGSIYDDHLTGDSMNNYLYGYNGDDILIGGGGHDYLIGGEGNDTFVFTSLSDSTSNYLYDIITDFTKGEDKINVSALAFNGLTNDQAQTDPNLLTYTYDSAYNTTIVTDESTFQFKLVGNIILDASDFIFNNGVGRDVIIGTSGNDVITGGLGNDSLYGEDGNDVIDGGNGNDVIDGGIGDDHLYGDDGDDLIWGRSGIDIIQGGNGDDVISGESGDDYLFGGNGNDELSGGSGNDHLAGNDGDDIISGGSGDDDIEGGYGNDTIYGNSGNNSLRGDDGDDIFYSGSGADIIIGGSGIDFVVYSQSTSAVTVDLNSSTAQQGGYAQGDILSNIERLFGSSYGDHLIGNAVNNHIYGQDGNDTIIGGSGFDTLVAGTGNDMIWGGGGNDAIYGDSGNNFLFGQEGNDAIYSGLGADMINGGAGSDYISYAQSTSAVVVSLVYNITYGGYAQGDTISNIENVIASNYNDAIDGSLIGNIIYGQGGNDIITGAGGSNILYGESGNDEIFDGDDNDIIYGGEGNDKIYGRSGDNIVSGGSGSDTLIGGIGNDTIHGDTGNDFIDARSGNNLLYGDDGDDEIWGGSGVDTIYGGDGNDQIFGGSGIDMIYGGEGIDGIHYGTSNAAVQIHLGFNIAQGGYALGDRLYNIENIFASIYGDSIIGNSKNNLIHGEGGNDIIDGASGNDTIIGGSGSDTLIGGAGNDTFSFKSLSDSTINSSDLIIDFTKGEDRINVSDLGFHVITANNAISTSVLASQILHYEYDSVNHQTIVNNEADTFEFRLSGNIALDGDDFGFGF